MTITPPRVDQPRSWHSAFSPSELAALQSAIPRGIHSAQVRTGRAHREYADPDDELYVYGTGMSRAVSKDIGAALATEASYREEPVPHSSRKLMFLGSALIFPIRVGDKMRQNKNRLRLASISQTRQDSFTEHGSRRLPPTDLTLFDDPSEADATGRVQDALHRVEGDDGRSELFVAYYSSSPGGVGQILWAPARLEGRYLHFLDPESLTFRKMPEGGGAARTRPQPVQSFADSPRPRTIVKSRTLKPAKQDQ